MLKLLFNILGNALGGIAGWMANYGNAKNTEARVINEEKKKEDELHEELKATDTKEGLDAIRRRLSP